MTIVVDNSMAMAWTLIDERSAQADSILDQVMREGGHVPFTFRAEFANGLVELMRIAYDYGKDHTRPASFLRVQASSTPGNVIITFETTEPAAVFYTLDGSVPTYASTMYGTEGLREGGARITVPSGTAVNWFSVDSAGNVERNYRPDGKAKNYSKGVAVVAGG